MNQAQATKTTKGNPLWEFATWAYAQAGVEKACLALQNRLNVDVNIVLFCMWLAYRGTGSNSLAKYLASALKLSRDWQKNLVEPLRTCLNNLKDLLENSPMAGADRAAATSLHERVKQSELDMEQLQTLALYSLVLEGTDSGITRSPVEQKDDALNNLTVYFAATGVKLDPLAQAHIMRILTALFGA